jgi:hypothetical protein
VPYDKAEINPDLVPVLMGHIDWAAQEAEARVERIMTSYSSTVGTASWTSAAASAALSVQIDENAPLWKKLMQVLDQLREGVSTAANMHFDQVDQGRSQIQAAAHAASGGGAMATNYQTRL